VEEGRIGHPVDPEVGDAAKRQLACGLLPLREGCSNPNTHHLLRKDNSHCRRLKKMEERTGDRGWRSATT